MAIRSTSGSAFMSSWWIAVLGHWQDDHRRKVSHVAASGDREPLERAESFVTTKLGLLEQISNFCEATFGTLFSLFDPTQHLILLPLEAVVLSLERPLQVVAADLESLSDAPAAS